MCSVVVSILGLINLSSCIDLFAVPPSLSSSSSSPPLLLLPPLFSLRAQERHAHELLHPGSPTLPDLQPSRVCMVVFRDDRGVKVPLFDSQVHCDQEGEKVGKLGEEGDEEGGRKEGRREESCKEREGRRRKRKLLKGSWKWEGGDEDELHSFYLHTCTCIPPPPHPHTVPSLSPIPLSGGIAW